MKALFLLALVSVVSSGCAHGYQAVEYRAAEYVPTTADDGLAFRYQYDAQPGYYGRKAERRGYEVVAVQVTNETDAPVQLDRGTLRVLSGTTPMVPVSPQVVAGQIGQPVWTHLLWSLLNVAVYDGDGGIKAFVPSGFVIAGINVGRATSANDRARRTLTRADLFGQTVQPGSTVEGLLFVADTGNAALSFDYVPRSAPAAQPVAAPAEAPEPPATTEPTAD